ncbi:MAG: RNA polymerase sigma factor [Roseburia sp.]|nr:RNA polymerase sigma factor [Ruminococcus sp.]MCM1154764.1 RNA polymerase sigma factor [Roseburia sp.]MCM1241536.1 RNA polymerase sigma factor [Roseburia sp.]
MSAIDKDTFAHSIEEYTPNLYRLAFGILHNREDAEDAVCESILKAYEKLHTLRKADSFRAWMMQITANEAKRIYAKNKKSTSIENVEDYLPAFADDHHELWDIVMEMDVVYRETIILYFYERLSIKEIAGVLHIPEGTVKSRLSRGKAQLRSYLG